MGDEIRGDVGEDGRTVGVGKDISQRTNTGGGATVHNNIYQQEREEKRPRSGTTIERLDRMEDTLELVADFVIGNERRDMLGLVKWQKAMEGRMTKLENTKPSEGGERRHVVVETQTAVLYIVIFLLVMVVLFQWVQDLTGTVGILIPIGQWFQAALSLLPARYVWTI